MTKVQRAEMIKNKYRQQWIIGLILMLIFFVCPNIYGQSNLESRYGSQITSELFEQHGSIMMIIDASDGRIVEINASAVNFYGYSREELLSMNISDLNILSKEAIINEMDSAKKAHRNYFLFEHRLQNGQVRNVEVYSYPFATDQGDYLYSIIHDVTERIVTEKAYLKEVKVKQYIGLFLTLLMGLYIVLLLRTLKHNKEVREKLNHSDEEFHNLFDNMHEGFALCEIITDDDGVAVDYKFLKVNKGIETYTGTHEQDIVGRNAMDIMEEAEMHWLQAYAKVALEGEKIAIEKHDAIRDRYFLINVYNGGYGKFIMVFIDVTEAKKREIEIRYLSLRDQLTGVYNRRYMEARLKEVTPAACLPLSIIMVDVNGLKLANDAFGHRMGDVLIIETANALKNVFREADMVTRIGGDEFLILLPNTSSDIVITMLNRLKTIVDEIRIDPLKLSIAVGYATRTSINEDVESTYKKAEDRMYLQKLKESPNSRSETIHHLFNHIKQNLTAVDRHQTEVGAIAAEMKVLFGLTVDESNQLVQAALCHDVGMVAIDKSITNKTETLSPTEMEEIRRHAESGYRILSAIDEYAEVAGIVLAHHERYDGTGYPKNLQRDEIPRLARIISVIDAYDAMTHPRRYRKVFSKEEAIIELETWAGKQFDPEVVSRFVAYLKSKDQAQK